MAVRRFVMLLSLAIVAFVILRAFGDLRRRTGPSLPHGPDVGSPGDHQGGRDTFRNPASETRSNRADGGRRIRVLLQEIRTDIERGGSIEGREDVAAAIAQELMYGRADDEVLALLPAVERVIAMPYGRENDIEFIALAIDGVAVIDGVSIIFMHPSDIDRWETGRIDNYLRDGFFTVEKRGAIEADASQVRWLRTRRGADCSSGCAHSWFVLFPGCFIELSSVRGIAADALLKVDAFVDSVADRLHTLHDAVDDFGFTLAPVRR